jgi:hypothetical protein
MKMRRQNVIGLRHRTAVLGVMCATFAYACGGADFTGVDGGVDGGFDGTASPDARKTDAPDTGKRDTGGKDTGAHDTGKPHDGTSVEASVDARGDVGGQVDAPDDSGDHDDGSAHDASHPKDAFMSPDAPHVCSGGAASCASGGTCAPALTCQSVACTAECCVTSDDPPGTACAGGTNNSRVCNASGACVQCNVTGDCPIVVGDSCQAPMCMDNACVMTDAPAGTACSGVAGGILCNGMGQCVECTPAFLGACTGTKPYCGTAGDCVQCLSDTNCSGGTPYCSGGTCVQCTSNSQCGLQSCTDGKCGGL